MTKAAKAKGAPKAACRSGNTPPPPLVGVAEAAAARGMGTNGAEGHDWLTLRDHLHHNLARTNALWITSHTGTGADPAHHRLASSRTRCIALATPLA